MVKKLEKAVVMLVTTNMTQREIAAELNISEVTLTRWKKTDEFKKIRQEIREQYLDDTIEPALRKMRQLLNSRSEMVQYQAAKDILDRTGYNPTEKIEAEISGSVTFIDDIPLEEDDD